MRIQLNVEVNKNEYHSICLNYLEYTKEKKAGKEHEHSTEFSHFTYNEVFYMDTINFYGKETLSIFNHWGNGLSISDGDPYIICSKEDSEDFDDNGAKFYREKLLKDFKKNSFSISLSPDEREKLNVTGIAITYSIIPEKRETSLIRTLTFFVLLLPLTDFISLSLRNISYLFGALETESVFILTLAFAQTRTRLINHQNYIRIALIWTGILFVVIFLLLTFNIGIGTL